MSFATKLQEIRTEHGISQEELAEMLNVSRQSVSKWERGKGYPEIDKLIHISERFGVSLDELLKEKSTASSAPRRTISLNKEESSQRIMYPENSAAEEIYPQKTEYADTRPEFRHEVVSDRAALAQYTDYSYSENVKSQNAGPESAWKRFRRRVRRRRQKRRRRLSKAGELLAVAFILIAFACLISAIFEGAYTVQRDYEPAVIEVDTGTADDGEFRIDCFMDQETGTKYVFNADDPYGIVTDWSDPLSEDAILLKNVNGEDTVYCYRWYMEHNAEISFIDRRNIYVIPYEMIYRNADIQTQQRCSVGRDQNNNQFFIPNYILNAFDEADAKYYFNE